MLSIILARICNFTSLINLTNKFDVLIELQYNKAREYLKDVSSELNYGLILRIVKHSEFWGQNS